jgi:rubrerythrin
MKFNNFINEMSKLPVKDNVYDDKQILRQAIIAEYDAVNLYEQFAKSSSNKELKSLMEHVAIEEKHHIGEFEYLLKKLDKSFKDDLEDGYDEAKEVIDNV